MLIKSPALIITNYHLIMGIFHVNSNPLQLKFDFMLILFLYIILDCVKQPP